MPKLTTILVFIVFSEFINLSLALAQKPELLTEVTVRLRPDSGFPHVAPGTKGEVFYEITNQGQGSLQLRWKVQIFPAQGGPLTDEKAFELAPQETTKLIQPDAVSARGGVARFEWELQDEKGRKLALKDSLGVMTLPGPEASHRGRFRFGWGTSLVHFVEAKSDASNMSIYAQMGCDILRIGDMWAYSQPKNGNQGYHAQAGEIANAAAKENIDLLYVLWGTPLNLARESFSHKDKTKQFAEETKTEWDDMLRIFPPDLGAWRKRIAETVPQFQNRVTFWEIWNDQDRYHDNGHHMPNGWVGNTEEYLELLRVSHAEIKKINPKLQVLTGGFFSPNTKDPRHKLNPDMLARVTNEAQDSFDILAAMDAGAWSLLNPMAEIRKRLNPTKPLWLTRVEQRGATPEELVRRLLAAKGGGANAFIWMWALNFDSGHRGFLIPMDTWKDKDRKANNRHSNFQIMPAGVAFVHAIGLLRSLEPEAPIVTGKKGEWVFPFSNPSKSGGDRVIGFWRDKDEEDSERQIPVGDAKSAVLIDLYGNETPLDTLSGGKVTLPMRHGPRYVRLKY